MLPDAFERYLRQHDPLLSLRFGNDVKCWIVERRAKRILPAERSLAYHATKVPKPEAKALEEWRSIMAGKRALFWTNVLDNRVLDRIRLGDLQQRGFAQLDDKFAAAEKVRRGHLKDAHERARQAADVVYHMLNKQSSRLYHGQADNIMADAMKTEKGFQDKRFSTSVRQTPTLLDAYSRPLTPKKDTKIHLATR